MNQGDPDNPDPDRPSPSTTAPVGDDIMATAGGHHSESEGDITTVERPFADAFLGDVRERLAARGSGAPDVPIETETVRDDALSQVREALPASFTESIADVWAALESDAGLKRTAARQGFDRDRPHRIQRHQAATSLRDNFQVHVLASHGFATFILFGIGVGIVISAWVQFIPPEFWLLSLPLILLVLAGILPLAGWVVGIWNPQQV